jgi:2-polyprenyl-3-methyl-5-hydroxy-6-metoxy-1,4-benzoquinol methylase
VDGAPGGEAVFETADIETASDTYARRFAGAIGTYFLDVQLRHTLDLLGAWPRSQVLDVGGGHGQLAVPLIARGFDVTVVGSDPVCEERLKQRLAPGSYSFRSCDLLSLPYPDRSFEVVVSFRLLPHVARWERLVAEMCRVARSAVIVDYPATQSINVVADRFLGVKQALERDTRPYRCFSRGELAQAFGAHGLRAAAFRPEFMLPMVLHRKMHAAALSRALEAAAGTVGLTRRFGSPVVARFDRG